MLAYVDTWNGKDYLHFVNPKNHTYYFYDFETRSIVNKILIEREGPNGIDEVWSTQAISQDTLISSTYKGLFFINDNSEIIFRALSNDSDINENHIPSFAYSGINDLKENVYQTALNPPIENENPYLFCDFNLDFRVQNPFIRYKDFWEEYTIYRQLSLQNLVEYGMYISHEPQSCRIGDKIIVSHKFSDDVAIIENQKIVNKKKLVGEHLESIDLKAYFNSYVIGERGPEFKKDRVTQYEGIFYDDNSELVYRFVLNAGESVLEDKVKGIKPVYQDSYLLVANKNLDKLGQLKVPNVLVNDNPTFIHQGRLYFLKRDQEFEDKCQFLVFELKGVE
ncbi:hypothetical protein EL17_13785 [Anditalea andensis]|uniref:Uncharacterized protein n=1 Tax=Anditalea andensis TaxID=1048983 RepID=A0A074KTV3_9BACT|nr:hypothetical protein EL17_13785 [Anditalea andensis]